MISQQELLREVEEGRIREADLISRGEEILERARSFRHSLEERLRQATADSPSIQRESS